MVGTVAGSAQKKPPREPEVEIVRIHTTRQAGRIVYDGTYRIRGIRPVNGLVLHLSFFESRGGMVSQQKIELETSALSPGEERSFEVQGRDVPRAVRFTVAATDRGGRDLNLTGPGPYPLD